MIDAMSDPEATQLLQDEVRRQRDRKDELVGRVGNDDNSDLLPSVTVLRGGEMVAAILAPQVDRDLALDAAWLAIPGYSADEVILTVDCHFSTSVDNPRTGKPWGPHEMQNFCEEGGCDAGLITDTLWVQRQHRDGRSWYANVPYHVHSKPPGVVWVDPVEYQGAEAQLSGRIPEVLHMAFEKKKTLIDLIAAQPETAAFDMPADKARIHTDCAVSQILTDRGFFVLMNTSDPLIREIVGDRW